MQTRIKLAKERQLQFESDKRRDGVVKILEIIFDKQISS
jgi:hypothetical protein